MGHKVTANTTVQNLIRRFSSSSESRQEAHAGLRSLMLGILAGAKRGREGDLRCDL
jgi:hypothetical protein